VRICVQIDHATNAICGAWWEIGREEELDCAYVAPLSMVALAGVMEMFAKDQAVTWWEHWDRLAARISPSTWWEVIEVDDESYAYELLYHLPTCHPRAVRRSDPR
jgi:hypothetical protein